MSTRIRLICACGLLALASACIGMRPHSLAQLESRGDRFQSALHAEYTELAVKESELYDWSDASRFARKAEAAAAGRDVLPEMPGIWGIAVDKQDELEAARERLLALLASTSARRRAPEVIAAAQASYDCWIEEQEEGHQPDMIAECRWRWETAMADVEIALQPAVIPAAAPVTESEVPEIAMRGRFEVHFDLDSAEVGPEARRTIERVVAGASMSAPAHVRIAGHADRSGASDRNARLSRQRAESVAALLIEAGFAPDLIETRAFGEERPAVPTADGVAHRLNRRVVITLL